ncbi:hypothetical protein TorRG33x02_322070, partial [Trema orientale]
AGNRSSASTHTLILVGADSLSSDKAASPPHSSPSSTSPEQDPTPHRHQFLAKELQ